MDTKQRVRQAIEGWASPETVFKYMLVRMDEERRNFLLFLVDVVGMSADEAEEYVAAIEAEPRQKSA
jgi:hypothetical protein